MRSRFVISLVLTFALLAVSALPLQAAGSSISVSSASGALGQQVDIDVSMENPSGLAGGSFNLYYDPDILEPIGVTAGEVLKNLLLETNINFQGSQGKAIRLVWAGTRGAQNSGLLCSIKFKLLQNGTSTLGLGELELFDSNLNPINAIAASGTLIAGTGQKPVNPPADNSGSKTGNDSGSNSNTGQNPSGNNNNGIPPFTGGSQVQTGQDRYQQQPNPNQQQQEQKQNPWQKPAEQQPVPDKTTSGQGSGTIVKTGFKDTGKHWAKNYIEQMAQAKIMSGYQDGSFQPDKNITRAEFARVIALAMKLQLNEKAQLNFSDREQVGDWARPSIAAAVNAGIISGYSDGSFQPGKTITRAEMAVIIARAKKAQIETGSTLTFSDSNQVPDWARSYVAAAVEAGIISGKENNRFAPLDPATRAEAACMIARMLSK